MNCKRYIILLAICISWFSSFSQNDARPLIEKGNKFYKSGDFKNAAVQYKHACQLDSVSFDAWYNFGNALYELKKFILSTEAYNKALSLTSDKNKKASILHNVGNVAFEQENFENAINFYKQALLLNPKDNDTRYNLALAQKKIKEQQDSQKSDNQKKDDKDKPKPSKFAEECMQKALELVAQYKFEEALKVMQDGLAKDKTVELLNDFTKKLEGIVNIMQENAQ